MYRETDLINCLSQLVGWRQNNNPDYALLPDSLIQTETGMYYQDDFESLVTIEYIDQATKNFDKYVYPDWVVGTTYKKGARVKGSDGKNYESDGNNNIGHDPIVSPNDWTEVDLLAEKLKQITRAAINKVVSRTFTTKKINEVTKSIFENYQLFDGVGAIFDREIVKGRFVGFEIMMKPHRDITTIIRRMGVQFTEPQNNLKIYLYHSSQEEPVKIWQITTTKSNSFQWVRLTDDDSKDWTLRYLDEDLQPGGSFYLGYYEADLAGQAINRGYDFANAPACSVCGSNYRYWMGWSQYMDVNPIEVATTDIDAIDRKIWDITKNRYQWSRNFGLNLDLSARCDVTDFFCRERTLFTDAIMKQVTFDVLHTIAYSTRENEISKDVKQMAMFELERKEGVTQKLSDAISALSFDTSDLNEACLPCNMKGGSTWTNV